MIDRKMTQREATRQLYVLCSASSSGMPFAEIFEGVKALLAMGADANAREILDTGSEYGRMSPLQLVIILHDEHPSLARLLVNNGADVNATNDFGNTPLHLAALKRKSGCCDLLIAHDANVNAANQANDTPLVQAALHGRKKNCSLLLEHGADIFVMTDPDNTILEHGARYSATYAFLLKEMEKRVIDYFGGGKTPLPARRNYLITDRENNNTLRPEVQGSLRTRQFHDLVAMPLIKSRDPEDRQLAQDIYNTLSAQWRDANRATEVQLSRTSGRGALEDILRAGPSELYADAALQTHTKATHSPGGNR